VKWPARGDVTRLDAPPMDACLRVEQGATTWQRLVRPQLRITRPQ